VKDWYDWIHRKYPDEKEHPLFIGSAGRRRHSRRLLDRRGAHALADLNPAFADHTVLISSVSGAAWARWSSPTCSIPRKQAATGEDAIAASAAGRRGVPVSRARARASTSDWPHESRARLPRADRASMLYGDFLARTVAVLGPVRSRGALELSWSRAWDATKRNRRRI
jgi:hypothetical protein